jgi:hypothetical protein
MGTNQKKLFSFAKVSLLERACTGCRNPTAKPNQRFALQLLMSR